MTQRSINSDEVKGFRTTDFKSTVKTEAAAVAEIACR